ncbi:unnamed protein product [Mycena citricolor]|uniref:Uncharacterized protein n=1 Tax=Mycena citricolor TaxID=2018698 RepID=A0AAD2HBF7_9AGAR|nr:unnamed protein product [Mycena citricolor]
MAFCPQPSPPPPPVVLLLAHTDINPPTISAPLLHSDLNSGPPLAFSEKNIRKRLLKSHPKKAVTFVSSSSIDSSTEAIHPPLSQSPSCQSSLKQVLMPVVTQFSKPSGLGITVMSKPEPDGMDDFDENMTISLMIPSGGPSHVTDADFPLMTGWSNEYITAFQTAVETLCSHKFNPSLSLKEQDPGIKAQIVSERIRIYLNQDEQGSNKHKRAAAPGPDQERLDKARQNEEFHKQVASDTRQQRRAILAENTDLRNQLDNALNVMRDRQEEVARLHRLIEQGRTLILQMAHDGGNFQSQLARGQEQVDSLVNRVATAQNQVAEASAEALRLQETLRARDHQVNQLIAEVQEREDEVESLRLQIKQNGRAKTQVRQAK